MAAPPPAHEQPHAPPEFMPPDALDLSSKALTALPQHAASLSSLRCLDLSSNALTDFSGLMLLPQLSVLSLARNRLEALPCLTALTALTQLNLHRNKLRSLVGPGGTHLLPPSLRRLSLSANWLQHVRDLAPLRQLPLLVDLCVDANPFMASLQSSSSKASNSSSSSTAQREAVLAVACGPSLLALDGQPVSVRVVSAELACACA
jgi:Leucine-rich repeat (LRR) protein